MGRHCRPSKAASLAAGTAPAAIAAGAMLVAPAGHAQAANPQRPEPTTAVVVPETLYKPVHVVARAVALSVITVHPGNSLSSLAGFWCHNPGDWSGIAGANRSQVKNPNLVYPGEKLVLDCRTDPSVHLPAAPVVNVANVSTTDEESPAPAPVYHHHHSYSSPSSIASVYQGSGTYSFAALESLWVSAGGPAWAESAAAAVAECESGGNSSAYNPSGATGLWQILGAVVGGNLDNPYTNALNAVSKFKASGDTWAQWVCKP